MAAKKTTSKTKARTRTTSAKSTQLTQFKFRWWMALILVGVVAVIGVIIVQYSNASGYTHYGSANCRWNSGVPSCQNEGNAFTFQQGFGNVGAKYYCPGGVRSGEFRQCYVTQRYGFK